jgi:hypothetical protein
MSISRDPNARRSPASEKGQIKGVDFVDTNVEVEKLRTFDKEEDWVNFSLRNMQNKVDRISKEAALSFAVALASMVLNVIILAKHFTH